MALWFALLSAAACDYPYPEHHAVDAALPGCNNGRLDDTEDCDGTLLGGATCARTGHGDGVLGCTATCHFDLSGCNFCGNGNVTAPEVCDGPDLAGATCESRGYANGHLKCANDCMSFDESMCGVVCGDHILSPGEECEIVTDIHETCMDHGFFGGSMACIDCVASTAFCNNCGNGQREAPEQCDGSDLNGATCQSRGFTGGPLGCDGNCMFDETQCN